MYMYTYIPCLILASVSAVCPPDTARHGRAPVHGLLRRHPPAPPDLPQVLPGVHFTNQLRPEISVRIIFGQIFNKISGIRCLKQFRTKLHKIDLSVHFMKHLLASFLTKMCTILMGNTGQFCYKNLSDKHGLIFYKGLYFINSPMGSRCGSAGE
jgi:hypothetical protein